MTPNQEGVQNKTFPLTSKRCGNTKQITADRGVTVKINISIASKRHKGKMAAGEGATDRSCCDVDSWQHRSCVEAEDDSSPSFSSLY